MKKYEIRNSTVKPVRRDSFGKDIRSMLEKVGHPVKYEDADKRPVVLNPGMHSIASDLNEGILGLQRGGFVVIREIKDIAETFKEHTLQEQQPLPKREPKTRSKATATQMGIENYTQKGGAEHEEAVNPDGDPNFLASVKTRKRRGKDVGESTDNEAQG